MEDCRKELEDAVGAAAPLFRPPFGGRRPDVLKTVRSLGMTPVMWSVTSYDWSAKSPANIVRKVERKIESHKAPRGEIILLHDGGHRAFGTDRHYTVEATRTLLEKYSAQGKKFVAVTDLAKTKLAAN